MTENFKEKLILEKVKLNYAHLLPTGKFLASKFNCPFYETSAKMKINIEEIFFSVTRDIQDKIKPKKSGDKKKRNSKNPSCIVL